MKITGGSFGVGGKVRWYEGALYIYAGEKIFYSKEQISKIDTRQFSERQFGIIGFFIGVVVLGVVLSAFLGVFGGVVALVLAIAGSFYSKTKYVAEISFADGKVISVEAGKAELNELAGSISS